MGVLRAEEPEQWFLISETELQSIETSLGRLETDRQSWESQARGLRNEAENLNRQLSEERVQYRILEQSFNEYERDQLAQLSLKNGEIAELKQTVADERLETAKYKGVAMIRLFIIIGLGAIIILYIAVKIYSHFRPLPSF